MHLSESNSGSGMSLFDLSELCEVEEEVVRSYMTYWIAKGVVREIKRDDHGLQDSSSSSSSSSSANYQPFNATHERKILYMIIENQAENAIKDLEEYSSGNSTGGGGGADLSEVRGLAKASQHSML